MFRLSIIILLLFSFFIKSKGQVLTINPGVGRTVCYNTNTILGGSPTVTGGKPPYSYNWQPTNFLLSNTVANPTVSGITSDIWYSITVTDSLGNTATKIIFVGVDLIYTFGAGIDTGFCYGQQNGVRIGAAINATAANSFTFAWTPVIGLNNPTAHNPIATPSVPTQYSLIVSDGLCPNNISQVIVTPFMPPYADASKDTTIDEGATITLHGTGGNLFWWQPDYNIKYGNTINPDVWPITTTTYTLYTEDSHKCSSSDTVRVTVIPGNVLFFYSAFTPNADGDNDVFYIGNIDKFPDNNLKIYNRYGKLIYSATNYANDWNGTYLGNLVPTGVYFYILDTGTDKKYRGSVTILR